MGRGVWVAEGKAKKKRGEKSGAGRV